MQYPICNDCNSKMTEYLGEGWYTCPQCGQKIRDNGNGTWTWRDDLFKHNNNNNNNNNTQGETK